MNGGQLGDRRIGSQKVLLFVVFEGIQGINRIREVRGIWGKHKLEKRKLQLFVLKSFAHIHVCGGLHQMQRAARRQLFLNC
jgi:hypothetical protein